MESQQTELDWQILETIEKIRAEHHACTGGEVARVLNLNRDAVKYRISRLRDQGIVDYSEVPGSLRLVEASDETRQLADDDDD